VKKEGDRRVQPEEWNNNNEGGKEEGESEKSPLRKTRDREGGEKGDANLGWEVGKLVWLLGWKGHLVWL